MMSNSNILTGLNDPFLPVKACLYRFQPFFARISPRWTRTGCHSRRTAAKNLEERDMATFRSMSVYGFWQICSVKEHLWSTLLSIHGSRAQAYQTIVLSLWARTSVHCILVHSVATLFGGLPKRCHYHDGPQTVDSLDGSANLVPISEEMDSGWIISIDLAKDCLSTGQSKCHRYSLPQSMAPMQQNKPKEWNQQQLMNEMQHQIQRARDSSSW